MSRIFFRTWADRGAVIAVLLATPAGCAAPQDVPVAPTPVETQAQTEAREAREEEARRFLFGIITIPLLPVRLVDAISDGAQGVKDMGEASRQLVTVAEAMPRSVREELKLAVDDTLAREEVATAVESFAAVSRSSERLAAVAEQLPTVLQQQSAQIDGSLQRAEAISASIEQATRGFADAGHAWTGTLEALQKTLEIYQAGQQQKTAAAAASVGAGGESSFSMADVVKTTEHMAATARELRAMIEQTNALISSDALRDRLEQVNQSTQQTVRVTTGSANLMTQQLLWRLTQLALLVFLLAVLWRIACHEVRRHETVGR